MKSHVSMETHQCVVCLKVYETGNLLLDQRLRDSMDRTTLTGHGLCPEHQALKDEGYVAMVELQRQPQHGEDPIAVPRTGQVCHIKAEAWPHLMSIPAPESGVCVVEIGVIDKLKGRVASEQEGATP